MNEAGRQAAAEVVAELRAQRDNQAAPIQIGEAASHRTHLTPASADTLPRRATVNGISEPLQRLRTAARRLCSALLGGKRS